MAQVISVIHNHNIEDLKNHKYKKNYKKYLFLSQVDVSIGDLIVVYTKYGCQLATVHKVLREASIDDLCSYLEPVVCKVDLNPFIKKEYQRDQIKKQKTKLFDDFQKTLSQYFLKTYIIESDKVENICNSMNLAIKNYNSIK